MVSYRLLAHSRRAASASRLAVGAPGAGRPRVLSNRCAVCGKEPVSGHTVSHSNIKNKRRFLPNLHATRVQVDGRTRKVRICTRCLRTSRKGTA